MCCRELRLLATAAQACLACRCAQLVDGAVLSLAACVSPCSRGKHSSRHHLVCSPLAPAVQYKALAAAHGGDTSSPAYQQGLGELHQHMATKLLLAVQANGGIYIKARLRMPAGLWAVGCGLAAGCCGTG